MTIVEWVERYVVQNSLEETTEGQYRAAANHFRSWQGSDNAISSITADTLNHYLRWMERDLGRSPYTIRGRRATLLVLLDAAAIAGLCESVSHKTVRRIKCPALIPKCLTTDQVATLLVACDDWDDRCRSLPRVTNRLKNGKPRSLFWKAFVAVAWDSALRLSDVLSLERQDIWPGGHITIVQRKSGRQHRVQFHSQTIAWIDELMDGKDSGIIFPMWCKRAQFYRHFKKLTTFAGVPCTTKWIRRGSASQYERDNPGQAWKHLGHAEPGIDRKFYLHPEIAYPERPMVRSVVD
jgi:integrase